MLRRALSHLAWDNAPFFYINRSQALSFNRPSVLRRVKPHL